MPVRSLPRLIVPMFDSQSDVTVANTTSITDLLRVTLPTDLVAGDSIQIEADGYILNNTGSNETPTFTFGIGSTTLAGSPNVMATSASQRTWRLNAMIHIESTSLQRTIADFTNTNTSASGVWIAATNINNLLRRHLDSSEDLTSAKDVYFRVTFTAASANLSMTTRAYSIWKHPNV